MARADTRLEPAPKIPPLTALRTMARVGGFLRPYRRQVVYAAVALVFAAAAVLAMGQGLKFVVDRGFPPAMPPRSIACWARCLG